MEYEVKQKWVKKVFYIDGTDETFDNVTWYETYVVANSRFKQNVRIPINSIKKVENKVEYWWYNLDVETKIKQLEKNVELLTKHESRIITILEKMTDRLNILEKRWLYYHIDINV